MKKFIIAAVIAMIGMPLASMADPLVPTEFGEIHAHSTGDDSGEIYAEGAATNEDPLDGYVGVEGDAGDGTLTVYCSDQGDWNDQDGDGIPDDEDEDEGQERQVCDPAA